MNYSLWWVSPLSVGVGVLLGFGVSEFREWRRREQERVGHFEALAAELQICADMARSYLRVKIRAPSYRMPLIAYQRSLPALLADGVLTFDETQALIRFYVTAQSFNFAVEQAHQLLMKKEDDRPTKRLDSMGNLGKMKARKLSRDSDRPNHYTKAIDVVRRRLPEDSRGRLSLGEEELDEEEAQAQEG